MFEKIKTVIFLTILVLLFIFIGNLIGGQQGMLVAFVIALGMNFFAYFYSDKLVLKHYKAVEVNSQNAKGFYDIVERLAKKANIPMPKVYIIPDQIPNAFATGRNPKNAAVAATEGLLNLMSEQEIEGVMAHELSHVRHYDILIGTIAATIAGAIAIIANILQYSTIFSSSNSNKNNGANVVVVLVCAILLPIAATIIKMAVSRNREFLADEGAARITGHPEWLQSALLKLESYSKRGVLKQASQESAHMFIVNPLSSSKINFANLFSTHPSTSDRIARLEHLKGQVWYLLNLT